MNGTQEFIAVLVGEILIFLAVAIVAGVKRK